MAAGRPQQYESEQVLDAVMHAFWQRGYDGTSLRDLLDATGLSKSSFYELFESKQRALEQSLERYCDAVIADLQARLRAAPSATAFIDDVLTSAAAETLAADDPRGCMIVNVATEFSARDPQVREKVAASVARVTKVLTVAVKRGQSDGDIAVGKDPNVLGRYVLSSLCGLRTMVKAGSSDRAMREVIGIVLSALR